MIINFCFHGIGLCMWEREPGESRYWITEANFLRILDEVVRHAHVRLSFDDGNRSDADIALAALKERGLSATFFPLAGRLDDPASLGTADLRELRAAGMQIGSHGWRHVPWRALSYAETARELFDARAALTEASGGSIADAALPLGRYDRGLLARLRRAGYRTVYTSDRFPAGPASWLQARYSATTDSTVESVRAIFTHHPSPSDGRNIAASFVKRLR